MGMYSTIRKTIMKNEKAFHIIRFLYTPFRLINEKKRIRVAGKKIIQKIEKQNNENPTIYYMGIPKHSNLGDLAQTYCAISWFNENYPQYNLVSMETIACLDKKLQQYIERTIKEKDFFVFQSGYCTTDTHGDHIMHKKIVKRFAQHKIIFLPQTVNIRSEKEVKATKDAFMNAKRLIFISRDRISKKEATKFLDIKRINCFPDIVTSLIGKLGFENIERNGVLLCVRNDAEKFYSEKEINNLKERIAMISHRVEITDTNFDIENTEAYKKIEQILLEKIRYFASFEVIITDRYHGTIFSLIANTPVIVLKTNDHKVSSGVDWFRGIYDQNAVQLAEDLENAYRMARQLCEKKLRIRNSAKLYEAYYARRLKDLIESI